MISLEIMLLIDNRFAGKKSFKSIQNLCIEFCCATLFCVCALWVIQGKYYNDNNPFYCRFGHVLMAFLGLDSSLFDDK